MDDAQKENAEKRLAYLLKIIEAFDFVTAEVKRSDGRYRMVEIKIRIDLDRPEEFRRILDELKKIQFRHPDLLY